MSVAVTVIGKLPVLVGVPDSTPVPDNVNPAGSVPVSVNVMGVAPPACVNVVLVYATPDIPEGIDVGPTVIVGQLIVSV